MVQPLPHLIRARLVPHSRQTFRLTNLAHEKGGPDVGPPSYPMAKWPQFMVMYFTLG